MMNMKEFKDYLAEKVKEYLPERYADADIRFQDVVKNGDQHLTGIMITCPGETVVPTIYINHSFDEYTAGRDIDEIVGEIADIRIQHETTLSAEDITKKLMDYDQIKDQLQVRMCDTKENEERLAGLVHTERSDYSATYHVLLSNTLDGQASVAVTASIMETWGVTQEQLHQDAMAADLTRGPVLANMGALMENMMFGTEVTNLLEHPEADTGMDGMPMFCLTNEEKMNAAGLIMQDNMLAQISEIVGGSYYVLPSSIHELLIVPESADMSVKELSANHEFMNEHDMELDHADYRLTYTAPLQEEETLDTIYEKFNMNRPEDFEGHSLSVSDVIVLNRDSGLHIQTLFHDLTYPEDILPNFSSEPNDKSEYCHMRRF